MKMANADEVFKIGKKLEKMISSNTADHGSTADLLKALQDMPMNLDVLQKTRIGMTVNNIRKASTKDENITLAKSLIKSWKKLLPADGPTSNSNSKGGSKKESKNSEKNGRDVDTSEGENSNSQLEKPATAATSVSDVGDPVRMKCRELIITALKPNGGDFETKYTPEEIGPLLEESIFQEFKNTDMKYKNRVRSRIANLKDSKNPRLRENVLLGLITPQKLAKMTAEEMASDEMKHLRAKYTKEAIDDHQMAKSGGTVTDLFKCGKCRKTNCTYNQVQTRSADEPMTTFVLCNECGNRWKFC